MSRKIIRDFEEELAQLRAKRDLLDREIQTVERMIRKAKGEEDKEEEAQVRPGRRQNVKGVVLGLLQERSELGLTPTVAVDLAEQRGVALEKASVSSLLSRLKNDGVVTHDGSVYRLAQRSKTAPADASADLLH